MRRRACAPLIAVLGCAVVTLSSCAKVIGANFTDLLPFPPDAGEAAVHPDGDVGVPPADASLDAIADAESPAADALEGSSHEGAVVDDVVDAKRDVLADVGSPDADTARPDARADAHDGALADARLDVAVDVDVTAERDGEADAEVRPPGPVLINELNAQGALEDFIEVYNVSALPFDLSGYALSQASGSFGAPNLASRVLFPMGTMLAPGARLVLVGNQLPPRGPADPCPIALPTGASCYVTEWGISKSGERVYLLAPDATVVDFADFPTVESGRQPPSGRSWGRFPDGSGPFQSTAYSPDAANHVL